MLTAWHDRTSLSHTKNLFGHTYRITMITMLASWMAMQRESMQKCFGHINFMWQSWFIKPPSSCFAWVRLHSKVQVTAIPCVEIGHIVRSNMGLLRDTRHAPPLNLIWYSTHILSSPQLCGDKTTHSTRAEYKLKIFTNAIQFVPLSIVGGGVVFTTVIHWIKKYRSTMKDGLPKGTGRLLCTND